MQVSKLYVAVGIAIGILIAGLGQEIRHRIVITSLESQHQAYRSGVVAAASRALAAHQAEIQRQQLAVAEIDHRYTQELSHAQAESDRLRAAVRSSERRLYIQTANPVSCSGVPEPSTTASVDHAASRAELDPRAAERIISITERGDRAIRQLRACQEYVAEITGR